MISGIGKFITCLACEIEIIEIKNIIFIINFNMEALLSLIVFIILLSVYYIPFLVAELRKIKNKTSVFWLNTFFGWSVIGWLVLLFYSSLVNKADTTSVVEYVKKKGSKN